MDRCACSPVHVPVLAANSVFILIHAKYASFPKFPSWYHRDTTMLAVNTEMIENESRSTVHCTSDNDSNRGAILHDDPQRVSFCRETSNVSK